MDAYTNFIIKHRKLIITVFAVAAVICAICSGFVNVDYDLVDYLPDDAASTKSLDIMNEEYNQAIPNARVLIYNVSVADALSYKEKMKSIDGVEEVNWLDDAENIYEPLELMDQKTVDEWYKDGDALYSLTIDESKQVEAVAALREIIGDDNCMSGSAVTNALVPEITSGEIQKIMTFVIPIVLVVLLVMTDSWFEPFLFLLTIGVAIVLNMGTNLIFGTISFVTNAAGGVLQLAVSMDYSIFLLHRFAENRHEGKDVEEAMVAAVKQSVGSVLSSGLTTVTGFAALILMRFKIGPDIGWVMAKAICWSLICVLCLLPALAMCTYKLIDKTGHRSFIPKMDKFAKFVMKARIPAMLIFLVLVVPSYIAQGRNEFRYGASTLYSTDATQLGRDINAIDNEYGASNPVVLMVPKGDLEKETQLNNDLKQLDYVSSVISYVNTVGASIPSDYVPSSSLSQLYSEHYSRIVVSLSTSEKDDSWYEKIDEVRSIAQNYYGDEVKYAGDLVSTEDLKSTIISDNARVNLLAIGFVFLILVLNFKSIAIPVILTLVIEASIWINLSVPYLQSSVLFYIAYLILNTVQLGATIDYAILFTSRYMEFRELYPRKEAAFETIKACTASIFTSAIILTLAGTILGQISTNGILSEIGNLLGRGATLSFVLVLFVLPALLIVADPIIEKTTMHTNFYRRNSHEEK